MKKGLRKLAAIVLTAAMALSIGTPVFAASTMVNLTEDSEYQSHRRNLEIARENQNTVKFNELEYYQKLESMSVKELQQEGFSEDIINEITSRDLEAEYMQLMFERAKLPTADLKRLGYSDEAISKLRTLDGDETISDIEALALAASLLPYTAITDYYYDTSKNKTYFIVQFGWEWDTSPLWLLHDCIGIGWNNEFAIDRTISSNYNKHTRVYRIVSVEGDKVYGATERSSLSEVELNTIEDVFDLNGSSAGSTYFAQEGYGTIALSQTGLANNAKLQFKYGHNKLGGEPSVALPWGIGFTFTGVSDIYSAPIAYRSTPAQV
ncbi:MAG: hypothetical protein IJA90_10685 [Peptococcaceae bacterium]|nr:hypothetical protein [Peptococcaceae bacterium]